MNCILEEVLKEGAEEYKALLKSKETYTIIKGEPSESVVYANTVVLDSSDLAEFFRNMGSKMLDIGSNFIPYIQSFSNLYFEKLSDTSSSEFRSGTLSGFSSTEPQIIITGIKGGKREVIGGLPLESSNFVTANILRSSIQEGKVEINKTQFINLIARAYNRKIIKANPVSIAKSEHTTKENSVSQTIADLKKMYGDNYKYLFSSPYIITKRFNSFDDFTGRTVLFYNKFPEDGRTVDDIISSAGGVGRGISEKYLGMLPFNINFHTTLSSLLEDFNGLSQEVIDSKTSLNAMAYHKSILMFYKRLAQVVTTDSTNWEAELLELRMKSSKFAYETTVRGDFSPDVRKLLLHLKDVQENNYQWFRYMENVLSNMIEESARERASLKPGQKQLNQFRGIYVNPQLVQSDLGYKSGVAPMDTSLLPVVEKLSITGLHAGAIRPQRLDFKFENLEEEIVALLSPDLEVAVENVDVVPPLSYDAPKTINLGKELRPGVSEVLTDFEKYGISPDDVDIWVKVMVAETLLGSSNLKFTETIVEKVEQKVKLNGDCI